MAFLSRQSDAVGYIYRIMPEPEFQLEITNQSATVRLIAPSKTRFYALGFFVGLTAVAMSLLLFAPGKHGNPSMWHSLSTSGAGSSSFLVPFFLLLSFPLFMLLMTERYVRLAFPSAETFHCDRSTLSITKVHWFDIHNDSWITRSLSLKDIQEIRYRRIAYLRGMSIWGIRFKVEGKTQRVLPGLKAGDAEKLLLALRAFGADVPDDPVVPDKLKQGQFG